VQKPEFEHELLEFVRTRYSGLLTQIADTGMMDEEAMVVAIGEFKTSRVAGGAES